MLSAKIGSRSRNSKGRKSIQRAQPNSHAGGRGLPLRVPKEITEVSLDPIGGIRSERGSSEVRRKAFSRREGRSGIRGRASCWAGPPWSEHGESEGHSATKAAERSGKGRPVQLGSHSIFQTLSAELKRPRRIPQTLSAESGDALEWKQQQPRAQFEDRIVRRNRSISWDMTRPQPPPYRQ